MQSKSKSKQFGNGRTSQSLIRIFEKKKGGGIILRTISILKKVFCPEYRRMKR
jgi:hypothetical protein